MTYQNSSEKIYLLTKKLTDNLDKVIEYFDLNLQRTAKMYYGNCPIHGGDNSSAFNLYYSGDSIGNWNCRTHECEAVFVSSSIGFVRGLLSNTKYNWRAKGDKKASFDETIKFIEGLIDYKLENVEINSDTLQKRKFCHQMEILEKQHDSYNEGLNLSREVYLNSVTQPCTYYSNKYSNEILNKYDVGICLNENKLFYNRAVVPIYNIEHTKIVGATARSIFNECEKCGGFHNGECGLGVNSKWMHSKGFRTNNHLYNFWFAKDFIKNTGTVILVEGVADVWKLEECGIHNSVAIFGSSLKSGQIDILNNSGAMNILVLTDNDKAGKGCFLSVKEQLSKLYNIYEAPWFEYPDAFPKDIGEMSPLQITQFIKPILEKINGASN